MMHRYVCTVSYDGTDYEGWQSQRRGTSIQETIEAVLSRICSAKINVTASGRTDAGVSASAQVFMFDTEKEMEGRKWMGALNGLLPKDIHIVSCHEADIHRFHARYNVRWKKYVYRINIGPYDVFTRHSAYQCPIRLDTEAMQKAIGQFKGTHDFTAFNSSPKSEYPDQVRTIFDARMDMDGNMIVLTFCGKGFLRYMVRMMSSALIEIGKHKHAPEYIQEMFLAKEKTIPHKNAPACGLRLEEVNYFEICALNEQGMIREFLHDDCFSFGMQLNEIETGVKENREEQYFCFTTRHSQENLGYFHIMPNQNELVLYDASSRDKAESLRPQMEEWLMEHGHDVQFSLKVKPKLDISGK